MNHAGQGASLTNLERRILEASAALCESAGHGFAEQIRNAAVLARTPSGVGFVTKLRVPDALAIEADSLPVVAAEHPALPSGAEFVVQVKAGKISSIEAYCFEGMWPEDEAGFVFRAPVG